MTAIKDIESTSARLLDRLTLQEKTLVENLIKFRHYDTKNLVVSRSRTLSISQA
jgi:hypothetical protein